MSPGTFNTKEDRARIKREAEALERLDLRQGTLHRQVMVVLKEGAMIPEALELVLGAYFIRAGTPSRRVLRELEDAGLVARSAKAWGLTERGAIRLSELQGGRV